MPSKLMLTWYENGNADVIDPSWLGSIDGDLAEEALPDLQARLCDGLFAKSWFDRQAWDGRQDFDEKTCVP